MCVCMSPNISLSASLQCIVTQAVNDLFNYVMSIDIFMVKVALLSGN